MNKTDLFVDSLYALREADLSDAITLQAKKCLLDYLGVTLAGSSMIEQKSNELLSLLDNRQGECTVIGLSRKSSIQNAALLNGISSHVAELDDGHRFGMLHPGTVVISALLPVAQREKITGSTLLQGIVTGYQAAVRIATSVQPEHKIMGFHATGTCGTLGAAAGVAAVLGFSKKQIKDALSAAATSASGILKMTKDGSELKPYNAGQAALGGLLAAFTARTGFKGPDDVLSGDKGFLRLMGPGGKSDCLEMSADETLEIEKVYFKPYAACRHCHPAIEAALTLRSKYRITPENIKSVKVSTYRLGVEGHDHTHIPSVASARMSTPFSVAASLATGGAGLEAFTPETVADSVIASLTEKIAVCSDGQLSSLVPQKRPAIVEIVTHDNRRLTESVFLAKGEPENPLTWDEVEQKFVSLATFSGKNGRDAENIIRSVRDIENCMDELFAYL